MTGFIESLASRAAGSPPAVAISPAISPEMLPDAFSIIEDALPIVPVSEAEPVKRNVQMPVRHGDEGVLLPAKPEKSLLPIVPVSEPESVKPEKSPLPVRKDDDIVAENRTTEVRPISRPLPANVKVEQPAFRAGPNAEAERQHKTTSMAQDAKSRISSDIHDNDYIKPAPPRQASPESPVRQTQQKDGIPAVSAPAAKPVQKSPSAAAYQAGSIKNAVTIRPEAKSIEEQPHTETPYAPKMGFAQQRSAEVRPTKLIQDQANGQDDDTVTINIGRIEVRAMFPQKHTPPAKEQGISLSEYLKLRAEGKL